MFDLHPCTHRMVSYLNDKQPGTEIPRAEFVREFNKPWTYLDPYFRTASRILFREHEKLVRLGTPRGTGPIIICTQAQKVEYESKRIRAIKLGTKRTMVISETIDSGELDPTTRNKHEVNTFLLSATHELHRTKTFNDLMVKRGNNNDLKPTKELLKFLAS